MRNFSSSIAYSCTYVLRSDVTFADPAFVRIRQALLITMGSNPECMTPSEEGVIADFIGWVYRNKEVCLKSSGSKNSAKSALLRASAVYVDPVFVYHNLNEGHSMAVVWADGIDH